MKRIIIIFAAVLAVAVPLTLLSPFFILPYAIPVLAPVLPRPSHVPHRAAAEYNWLGSGTHWNWRTQLPDGCASWTAAGEGAVDVALSLDSCDGRLAIRYNAYDDTVVFMSGELIDGRIAPREGGKPCAFLVPEPQKRRLQNLTAEAIARAETPGEFAVLRRVASRLSTSGGAALTSDANGHGCYDRRTWSAPGTVARLNPLRPSAP